jgi:hypothetical protein
LGKADQQPKKSFLGLAPVYTWDKHTKLIEEKVKDLTETDFNQAVSQLKHLKRTTGEVANCTDRELQETVIDIGASFVELKRLFCAKWSCRRCFRGYRKSIGRGVPHEGVPNVQRNGGETSYRRIK